MTYRNGSAPREDYSHNENNGLEVPTEKTPTVVDCLLEVFGTSEIGDWIKRAHDPELRALFAKFIARLVHLRHGGGA